MDYECFHESLRYHLARKGHGGQAQICRHTDIPPSYLSRIVRRNRRAGIRTQRKIARFFGYGLEAFVEVGRRITLGEDPETAPDLLENLPEEQLLQRLTEAVRKEMATARRLNQTRFLYEDIVENSRQMIVRFDRHLNVSFVNRAFERLSGQDRSGLVGQSWKTLVKREYHRPLSAKIGAAKGSGGSFSIELSSKFSRHWFYLTVTVFPSGIGDGDRMQWFGLDVTERRKLVDRLQFIQHGVEMSYVPTLYIGRRANIVYVNRAVCKLLGYSKRELESMHVWDINPLIPEKTWDRTWAWFEEEEDVVFTGRYRTKAGAIIPVEFHVSNLRYPDGRRYNVVFVKPL